MYDKDENDLISAIRRPPQSVQAEQAVLGGLLIDNQALQSVDDLIQPDDFCRRDHALIYATIVAMQGLGHPADVLTLSEELRNSGKLADAGGMKYLVEISNNVPSAANIRRYAEIVHNKSILRQLIRASELAISSAMACEGRDVDDIMNEAERNILAINEKYSSKKSRWKGMDELMKTVAEEMIQMQASADAGDVIGVKSGFHNLDNVLAGLQRGDLIIVAGRPSMGKTSFAVNIAEDVAVKQELPAAIFSMEMSAEQLAKRLLSSVSNLDSQRLRKGKLTDSEWTAYAKGVSKLSGKPLYIDDTPGLRITDLASRARRLVSQVGPLSLIVVDYIQLMSGRTTSDNRASELSEISRGLKALAKELSCPVIVLSQLNRSLESRPDKRPVMSDLRESGAIEQDADVIIFIYRDVVYNENTENPNLAEIIIRKQRNGPIGTLRMVFQGSSTRFLPWAGDIGYAEGLG